MQAEQHMILRLDLGTIGGSALTSEMEVPKDREIKEMDREIPVTYVPGRNIIFLSHALAWAEVIGAVDIFLGINAVDYSGYPDCRPVFLQAFERMANLGTKAGSTGKPFKLHAPLIELTKKEIVEVGMTLGVDYSITHSCYDPQGELACGRCDACILRLKGFSEAGLKDPVRYVGEKDNSDINNKKAYSIFQLASGREFRYPLASINSPRTLTGVYFHQTHESWLPPLRVVASSLRYLRFAGPPRERSSNQGRRLSIQARRSRRRP